MSFPQLQEIPAVTEQAPVEWSLATRIGFRFVFTYFFLYIAPGPVGSLGVDEKVRSYHALFSEMWHQIVPWVGNSVLGLNDRLREIPNGSGDQLYDYVLLLCIFTTALLITAIWSLLDRNRKNYQQLYQWLRLFMRLNVASAMMIYGASKILPMQFADIPLGRHVDTLGHLSPLGLLWTFMGYSRAYSFFGGIAELLGGILLVVPQFSTLGALVSLGVLSNVLMLNLCYDVPRKILTTHLVLIALFLILPDVKRILNLFIFNRVAEPARTVPFLKDKQQNRNVLILQYVFGAVCLALAFYGAYPTAIQNQARIAPPLRGIWSVESFSSDGVSVLPLVTEQHRWRNVILDTPDFITIQRMQGPLELYSLKLNASGKDLTLSAPGQPTQGGSFNLEPSDADHMTMNGELSGHAVRATLKRVDLSDPTEFLLANRGFHWVTPVPRWR